MESGERMAGKKEKYLTEDASGRSGQDTGRKRLFVIVDEANKLFRSFPPDHRLKRKKAVQMERSEKGGRRRERAQRRGKTVEEDLRTFKTLEARAKAVLEWRV